MIHSDHLHRSPRTFDRKTDYPPFSYKSVLRANVEEADALTWSPEIEKYHILTKVVKEK